MLKANCVSFRFRYTGFVLALLLPLSAFASDKFWMTDVSKALDKASKQDKDVLMHFTGTDWCVWCDRLHEEVFDKKTFLQEAPKHYVFVELDFPRRKKLPPKLKEQNQKWLNKLGVRGFPTIYLLDSKGKPYAKTGYKKGGAEKYLKHLKDLRSVRLKRDKALEAAKSAKGLEKAKLLHKALEEMSSDIRTRSYEKIVQKIIKLDPENKAGLKNKYRALRYVDQVNEKVSAGDSGGALEIIKEAFKKVDPEGQQAQDLYFAKAQVKFSQKNMTEAEKSLKAALKAAPEGKKARVIKRVLDTQFSKVGKRLQEIQKALQGGQLDAALELADKALEKWDISGEKAQRLRASRGIALLQKEDKEGALKALQAAVKEAPETAMASSIKKLIARQFGEKDEKLQK